MTPGAATRLGLIAALVVLAADQASKYWILHVLDLPDLRQVVLLPVLSLTFVRNHGVTFGLLNGLGSWSHFVAGGGRAAGRGGARAYGCGGRRTLWSPCRSAPSPAARSAT